MKFAAIELDPAENPGVLDTATWDILAATVRLDGLTYDWRMAAAALSAGGRPPASSDVTVWPGSAAATASGIWFLASLRDGQDVLVYVGAPKLSADWRKPFERRALADGSVVAFYPCSAAVLDRYCRQLKPEKAPRALGSTPRLGIGTRMTVQMWPGIFAAMARCGFAANTIQNSIRELSLLDDILAARPPEKNYSTGIGTIEVGWTGSTYEGLWVAGVLAALKADQPLAYGADADHIQVKRGPAGVERAKQVIDAARYYSFFTLDMADVLSYAALNVADDRQAAAFLAQNLGDPELRRTVMTWHAGLDQAALGRFVGKYWAALDTVETLAAYIGELKDGVPFDLELTIDEHPPEVGAFDCLTSDAEVLFLAREIQRRKLPITHLAPNFGQEKGYDYRGPDGLAGLEHRARAQFEIAERFGLMLDVHSGDDLSRETRRVFGRASQGRVHFKVSPRLQLIYAEVLQEYHPELFQLWWDDAVAYAQREAAQGSPAAQDSLAALAAAPGMAPSARHKVFQYYSFPFVGRRDAAGEFLHRAAFYRLSPAFLEAFRDRLDQWLGEVADDVFPSSSS